MKIMRLTLLTLWTLSLVPGATAGQGASAALLRSLDLKGYTAELARWSAAARRLEQHPEEAGALRKQLPNQWLVEVQEQHFIVPTQWLGSALERLNANPQQAKATSQEVSLRLQSMIEDSQQLVQLREPGSSLPRDKLDEILKRREYRSVRAASEEESLLDQVYDWFWKFIDKLFSGAGSHPSVTRVLLWGLVVALGMIFLGWLIYSIANTSLASLSLRRTRAAKPLEEPARNWQEWVQRARSAASRGDYREAVRIVYGAALRRLEAAGLWDVDPARTHREYVRLLPTSSFYRPALIVITNCFERVWYGHVEASAADYEAVLTELESLP